MHTGQYRESFCIDREQDHSVQKNDPNKNLFVASDDIQPLQTSLAAVRSGWFGLGSWEQKTLLTVRQAGLEILVRLSQIDSSCSPVGE